MPCLSSGCRRSPRTLSTLLSPLLSRFPLFPFFPVYGNLQAMMTKYFLAPLISLLKCVYPPSSSPSLSPGLSFYLFSYRYTFLLVSDLTFDDGDAFSADALDRVIFTTRFSHPLRNIAVASGRRMKDKIVRRDCVRTSHYPCLSGGIRKYRGGARDFGGLTFSFSVAKLRECIS